MGRKFVRDKEEFVGRRYEGYTNSFESRRAKSVGKKISERCSDVAKVWVEDIARAEIGPRLRQIVNLYGPWGNKRKRKVVIYCADDRARKWGVTAFTEWMYRQHLDYHSSGSELAVGCIRIHNPTTQNFLNPVSYLSDSGESSKDFFILPEETFLQLLTSAADTALLKDTIERLENERDSI